MPRPPATPGPGDGSGDRSRDPGDGADAANDLEAIMAQVMEQVARHRRGDLAAAAVPLRPPGGRDRGRGARLPAMYVEPHDHPLRTEDFLSPSPPTPPRPVPSTLSKFHRAAYERALEVLLDHLDEAQRATLLERGEFVETVGGDDYRFVWPRPTTGYTPPVLFGPRRRFGPEASETLVDPLKRRLTVYVSRRVPTGDHALALLLMLRWNRKKLEAMSCT